MYFENTVFCGAVDVRIDLLPAAWYTGDSCIRIQMHRDRTMAHLLRGKCMYCICTVCIHISVFVFCMYHVFLHCLYVVKKNNVLFP